MPSEGIKIKEATMDVKPLKVADLLFLLQDAYNRGCGDLPVVLGDKRPVNYISLIGDTHEQFVNQKYSSVVIETHAPLAKEADNVEDDRNQRENDEDTKVAGEERQPANGNGKEKAH